MTDAFRCSAASRADGEPMAGTAPPDRAWLFVEHAGSWGRQAVPESRLPAEVKAFLAGLSGIRVQLVRRHRARVDAGVRVFTAVCGPGGARVGSTVLADVAELPGLDLAPLTRGDGPGLTGYDHPLWLVCTNGRRDRCCAELGRRVAEALATTWPEATWETTHLGGHRFAGTLLALPAGVTLGRLDARSAVWACTELEQGRWPTGQVRGRAGVPAAAQVAEQHLRDTLELGATDAVHHLRAVDGEVLLRTPGGRWRVRVATEPGRPRPQSCADLRDKPVPVHTVLRAEPLDG